ncbi:MAG: hypothetical protein Q3972_00395 [Corynebacterium sp.]|nr:hypothetical protein [Corynebacterium sp.]
MKKRLLALGLTTALLTAPATYEASAATYTNAGVTVVGTVSTGSNLTSSQATSGTTIKETVELTGFDAATKVTVNAYLVPIVDGKYNSTEEAIATGNKTLTTNTSGTASGDISLKVPANAINENGTYGVYVEATVDGQKIALNSVDGQTVKGAAPTFKDQLTALYNQASDGKSLFSTLKSLLSSLKSLQSTVSKTATQAADLLSDYTTTTTETTTSESTTESTTESTESTTASTTDSTATSEPTSTDTDTDETDTDSE